jgi:hypothetical protein
MNIEFNTPRDHVKQWVMTYLLNRMLDIHDRYPFISRAQVDLREKTGNEKSCDIELTIFQDSVFVHRSAGNFEEACLHAVSSIEERLKETNSQKKEGQSENSNGWEIPKNLTKIHSSN